MVPRVDLGLASALVLLAACGPSKPSTDGRDEVADEQDGDGDGEPDESGEGEGEGETGTPEAMCTAENYEDELYDFYEVGCVPVEADGTCAVCDLECMEAIVHDCPGSGCTDPIPDLPCINVCGQHALLCSEQLGDQCCHLVTAVWDGPVPGRPLREHGAPRLPELFVIGEPSEAGSRYREFARYERASVDAFLYAAALLEQLGAPGELVEDHRIAAREEAGHARLALAAAERLDGCAASLAELPGVEHDCSLERFVVELIHDGCIGELVAAHEAADALARLEVREREPLRRYWEAVVVEETGHANLAWRTLEWLLAARPELGSLVIEALAVAMGSQERSDLHERAIAELLASAGEVVATHS